MENCPDCGAHLSGGWIQALGKSSSCRWFRCKSPSTSTLLGLARPATALHTSGGTGRRGLGQQRLGVNLLSLIATLREEGRLPIRSVQWYLDTVHQLRLSVGAIVKPDRAAGPTSGAGLDRRQPSGPATKPAGQRGQRLWTFSTPTERYFLRRGRGKAVGEGALATPPTTIMTAPSSAAGPTCCGTSTTSAPATPRRTGPMGRGSPPALCRSQSLQPSRHGKGVLPNWPGSGSCWPSAALSCLTRRLSRAACRRIERFIKELFVFVAETCRRTTTPPSAACANLDQPQGHTRSEQGTESDGIPLRKRQLLISPQL